MKEKTSKEFRKEIYDWIETYVGKIPPVSKGYLSKMLHDYVKNHNTTLVKLNNELFEALNEKGRIVDELRKKKLRNRHNENTFIKRDLILE